MTKHVDQKLYHWAFCWPWQVLPRRSWFFKTCRTQLDARNRELLDNGHSRFGQYYRIFGVEVVIW